MMNQLPSVHASGDLTLEEASAGSIFANGSFPFCQGQKNQKIAEGPCRGSFASVSWSAQKHPKDKRK